jgi:glycerol-3-phosphate dehydrogenase subunit B
MSYDTIVVGAGLAGLTAALRLTEQGQRVLVVARGIGATHLAPATIDVLGYVEDARVENPGRSLQSLLAAGASHPYAHVGAGGIAAALTWFCTSTARLGYAGSLDANVLLPTAIGVPKPSTLVPQTMAGGDVRAGGRYVFVGFKGFKDFHPALLADNLTRAQLAAPVTARALELEPPPGRRGDLSGRVMAGRFDSGELGDWLVTELDGRVDADERIGVPAVLGMRNANETWQALETKLGRSVFEVATLPPSVPGMRLYDVLARQLRDAGTRIVLGVRAVGARVNGGRIEALDVANATGPVSHPTGSVVLASGGFASGGLELDSFGATHETVFDLPLIGVPAADRVRFAPGYFDEQPLATAGVATDDLMRPVSDDGTPVYANLHAAGAILGGAVPWKEKSGSGISVASGYAAAEAIMAPTAHMVPEAIR